MNRILVTGATGNVGRQVVSQLLAAGACVRALSRHPAAAGLPAGVESVYGDLTLPETLDPCLDGVDSLFLVWTAPPDAVPAALERIAKKVRRIVFLSSPYNVAHPAFQATQPNPVSALHAEVERLIRASGMAWTFLRPSMFAAMALPWWAPQIRVGDVVRWPCALALSAPIHQRDIAAVAVRALRDSRSEGAEYMLTGPQSMSQLDLVATIGEVLGRPLRLEEITPDEWRRELPAFIPAFFADTLLLHWAASIRQPAMVTSTVAAIAGTPPRSFRDWVTDNAAGFR